MVFFRKKGDHHAYAFCDVRCIGMTCWEPQVITREKNGKPHRICLKWVESGCPGTLEFDRETKTRRRLDGWVQVIGRTA